MDKYDFVIHGASGFTGQYVVEYVHRAAQEQGTYHLLTLAAGYFKPLLIPNMMFFVLSAAQCHFFLFVYIFIQESIVPIFFLLCYGVQYSVKVLHFIAHFTLL
jgi:hypothetical protein